MASVVKALSYRRTEAVRRDAVVFQRNRVRVSASVTRVSPRGPFAMLSCASSPNGRRLGQRLFSAAPLPRRVAPRAACRATFPNVQFRLDKGCFLGDVTGFVSRHPQPQFLHAAVPSRRLVLRTRALFEKFTEPALRSVVAAQKETQRLQSPEVECHHLMLGLISADNSVNGFLETGVTVEKARAAVENLLERGSGSPEAPQNVPFSRDTNTVMKAALQLAQDMDVPYVLKEHLLISLMRQDDLTVNKLLASLNLSAESILAIAKRRIHLELGMDGRSVPEPTTPPKKKSSSQTKQLKSVVYKFNRGKSPTPTLDSLSKDLCLFAARGQIDPMIGRQTELRRVIQILARKSKNNPILLGEAGVGKTAVAEGLAHCIVSECGPDGEPLPTFLKGKRIMQLDYALLIAGAKERGELEKRVTKIVAEVRSAGDVILMIDEIHTMISSGSITSRSGEGGSGLDVANILKPPLARGELQCIGATTLMEHRKYIESDEALARRFQPVMIKEPTLDEAVTVLKGLQAHYEHHHKCVYTDRAIEAAVKLSHRYIHDRFLPDKAIDVMDEAGSHAHIQSFFAKQENEAYNASEAAKLWRELEDVLNAKAEHIRDGLYEEAELLQDREAVLKAKICGPASQGPIVPVVDLAEVEQVISTWTGIPPEHLTTVEAHKVVTLDEKLAQEIIGQRHAISAVSRAMCRAMSGIRDPERPIASFLFSGPTGVGKTELTKVLGDHCFGSRDAIIRLDMSEYMERHNTSKLIGAPPGYVGYGEGGKLTEPVRRNPHSLILFDEIEKAHPDVFNMLLQILEDGRLTDSQGRTVSFENTIIIMTSNIGSNIIAQGGTTQIGFSFDEDKETAAYERIVSLVHQEMKNYFRPELINRIDEIVVFENLGMAECHEIANILLNEVAKQLLELHGIHLHITIALKDCIVKQGYDRSYGARPLRREITRVVDDTLSDAILANKLHKGQHIVLDVGSSIAEIVLREIDPNEVCIEEEGRKYGSVVLYTNQDAPKTNPIWTREDRMQMP